MPYVRPAARTWLVAGTSVALVLGSAPGAPAATTEPPGAPPGPAATWTPIGPVSQGGHLLDFPDSSDRVVAAPSSGRCLQVSEDAGTTWTPSCLPVVDGNVREMSADPSDQDTWYVELVPAAYDRSYAGRVYRTQDAGATWTRLALPDVRVRDVAVSADGQVVAVSAYEGVWLSQDGGQTFASLGFTSTGNAQLALSRGDLFVTSYQGVIRVQDVATDPGPPEVVYPYPYVNITLLTADDEAVLVASADSGLIQSTDGGETWQAVLATYTGRTLLELVDGVAWFSNGSQGGLVRSDDHGDTWTQVTRPDPKAVLLDVVRVDGAWHIGAAHSGVYRQSGSAWTRVAVTGETVRALEVRPDGEVTVGNRSDVYSTPLPATCPVDPEWGISGSEGNPAASVSHVDSSNAAIVKVQDQANRMAVLTSHDAGRSWDETLVVLEGFALDLLVHPADPDLVLVSYVDGAGSVLLGTSQDGGRTWISRTTPAPFVGLAGDAKDPATTWAAAPDGVWKSSPFGFGFTRISTVPASAIASSPVTPNGLVIASDGAIWWSANGGVTFTRGERSDGFVTDLDFSPTQADAVVASTGPGYQAGSPVLGSGVLSSRDGGQTWDKLGEALPDPNATQVEYGPYGDVLVGTLAAGAFRICGVA